MAEHSSQLAQSTARTSPFSVIVNLICGALMGLAELVPGVSGGTVALVTGIYERLLENANALITSVKVLFKDRAAFPEALRRVEWGFLVAVGVGMVAMVFGFSSVMSNFVENSPQTARALFLGMVAVSIYVPFKLIDAKDFQSRKLPAIALFIVAAVAVFFLTGITSAEKTDPSMFVVFGAAAIAICALVLPGISGSFMLLAMGLYGFVIGSVADRDFKVILIFGLGALTGILLFIRVLNYLLHTHHTLTMAAMAGFMLGSLRALWPWQSADAQLLAPSGNVGWLVGVMVLGGVIALVVMQLERFSHK